LRHFFLALTYFPRVVFKTKIQLYPYSNLQEFELAACPDADTTRIIVTNLTGTLTPDNPTMALESIVGNLDSTGLWDQTTGKLTVIFGNHR